MLIRLSVALIAFCVGVGCESVSNKYDEVHPVWLSTGPKIVARTHVIPLAAAGGQLRAGSLPHVLQRIDEKYKRQCQLPSDWYGEWQTVRQLAEFRACNERWVTARREAINSEMVKYLVHY